MRDKEKDNMRIDFKWVFTGGNEPFEDDRKYKDFLAKIYKSNTSTYLLLKKEEEFLRNY